MNRKLLSPVAAVIAVTALCEAFAYCAMNAPLFAAIVVPDNLVGGLNTAVLSLLPIRLG